MREVVPLIFGSGLILFDTIYDQNVGTPSDVLLDGVVVALRTRFFPEVLKFRILYRALKPIKSEGYVAV